MRIIDTSDRAYARPAPSEPAAPVRVNGAEISRAAIAREIQHHPAPSPVEAHRAAVRALVTREILLQEAARLDLEAFPRAIEGGGRETDEDALVRALLEREVHVEAATETRCRRFFDAHRERLRAPDLFEASHILFAADPKDADALSAARAAARDAIDELARRPDRFAELAATLSSCSSARQGGALGQLSAGRMAPEFEAALRRQTPGETSREPVATHHGIHVVRLERFVEGRRLPYEHVRDRIADYLADIAFRRAVHEYLDVLAGRARVEGARIAGAAG